ncbi:hypothetical protein RQP46_006056 [Phenoliferia psychrophenolica]
MTGESIAFVNGQDHKRHRRILNPAFLEAPVNKQVSPMFEYSRQLRDRWTEIIGRTGTESAVINVFNEYAKTKEALRLHVVFERLERAAEVDDVIPLSKPVTLKNGQVVDRIPVQVGQRIFIPLAVLNWSEDVWGPTAKDFVPERWLTDNSAASNVPTVYSGLSTFGAGARSCIGYRMAILELKVVLCVMAANFKFEPRDGPPIDVRRISSNFMIPLIKGEEAEGPMIPVKVTRL